MHVGSEAYNQKLSFRRALAVKRYLMDQGIAPDRLSAEGKGEGHPIVGEENQEQQQLNRRVEITLFYTK